MGLMDKLGAAQYLVPGHNLYAIGKGIANATDNPAKPVKTQKEMLAKDVNTLQNNPDALGLSEAQRRQMLGEATQASDMARQAQVTQMGQTALAGLWVAPRPRRARQGKGGKQTGLWVTPRLDRKEAQARAGLWVAPRPQSRKLRRRKAQRKQR